MVKRKAFGISRDLNEGISQTVNAVKNNAGQLRYEVIPLVKINLDPENPRKLALQPHEIHRELSSQDPLFERKNKELDALKSLAASIKKTGVRNAVEVFKDGMVYRLISGERRVLASLLAGKDDIQARVLDAKPSEFDIRYLQWIENIEREDLSLCERIDNVKQLIDAHHQMQHEIVTATLLKEILGCSLPHAMTYLTVIEAPQDIQILLRNNVFTSLEKAAYLAKIADTELRLRLTEVCLNAQLSLTALRKLHQTHLQSKAIKVAQKGKGRVAKRVTLGFTNNTDVVKHLIELVLLQPQYQNLRSDLKAIDWTDYSSVGKHFQLLIKQLEQTLNRRDLV